MNDYIIMVDSKVVDKLLHFATENGIAFDMFEGILQDNYIFYNTSSIIMKFSDGKAKCRKHIIIREKYLNEWSSGLEMVMTNDNELIEKYRVLFDGEE